MEQSHDSWHLSSVIDWADAAVANPIYEWVALWFGFCGRAPDFLEAFMKAYDPSTRINEQFVTRLLAYTLVHRFAPLIIAGTLADEQGQSINSVAELKRLLFAGLD